jgi:hypothetical protein
VQIISATRSQSEKLYFHNCKEITRDGLYLQHQWSSILEEKIMIPLAQSIAKLLVLVVASIVPYYVSGQTNVHQLRVIWSGRIETVGGDLHL